MKYGILLLIFLSYLACQQKPGNPPAEGFNAAASDEKAIEIADEVMLAMGGRAAWDQTRIIGWSFFGRRYLTWNKQNGDLRIDSPGDSTVYLVNLKSDEGRIMRGGEEMSHPDSLAKYLERAKGMWINDSYWLLMPFKLKDSGVTLTYLREEADEKGNPSDVLQLTFSNVGNTPDNKYEVWVNKEPRLVMQWAFYRDASQDEPNYIRPWDNYQPYGDILISADRSDNGGPANVRVMETVDHSVFSDWSQPDFVTLE